MSGKGKLMRLLGGVLLREAEVLSVEEAGPQFRLVHLAEPSLAGVRWEPGDKIQVLLPGDDVRTYTPMRWGADGSMSLLVYLQGDSPASRWGRRLAPGQRLRFLGPQRSLQMPPGALTLLGDETSLAVAASYRAARRLGEVSALFEVAEGLAVEDALEACGLPDAVVVRRERDLPRGEALARALPAGGGGHVGLTGGGALIQRVRAQLRSRGVRDVKVKAYWVEGRAGLD